MDRHKYPEFHYFRNRMYKRDMRHPGWRQTAVNCGFMCYHCYSIDFLELHEPFGEDHWNEGRMQQRVLMCFDCHMEREHPTYYQNGWIHRIQMSKLADDIEIEIYVFHRNYDQWIKDFGLKDTFARYIMEKE